MSIANIYSIETCNGGSDCQRDGAEAEEEPDSLRGPRRPHDVEGDGSQKRDEAAVEKSHDQGEDDHGFEDEALE